MNKYKKSETKKKKENQCNRDGLSKLALCGSDRYSASSLCVENDFKVEIKRFDG